MGWRLQRLFKTEWTGRLEYLASIETEVIRKQRVWGNTGVERCEAADFEAAKRLGRTLLINSVSGTP